ncbi:hypothetical protein [Marinirhabdus gelatinilytica]|nr:hypothetical protein [Marinirhabdus gelatinilytica]
MRIRFRNFLKKIGLIKKDKLEVLESVSKDIKRLIEEENQTNPIDPKTHLNGMLWLQMYQVLEIIEKMKKGSPNLDWNN